MKRSTSGIRKWVPLDRTCTCGSRSCTICNKLSNSPLSKSARPDPMRNKGFRGSGTGVVLVEGGAGKPAVKMDVQDRYQTASKTTAQKGESGSGTGPSDKAPATMPDTPTPPPPPADTKELGEQMALKLADAQAKAAEAKKNLPRGKPFAKGQDPRRDERWKGKGGQGEGEGEGEPEPEPGEGGGMPQSPENEEWVRQIAREEDEAVLDAVSAVTSQTVMAAVESVAKANAGMWTVQTEFNRQTNDNLNALKEALAKKGEVTVNRELTITLPDLSKFTVTGRKHPLFEAVLKRVVLGLNVLLVGPAGCGKTTLAKQVAEALKDMIGNDFDAISCSAGLSEMAFTGRLIPVGEGGTFQYVESDFVRIMENGGLFLVDEIDAADGNVLLVINSLIANGYMNIPHRVGKTRLHKHKNARLVAAANTFGTGANRMYVGRNQLDAATLSRFAGGVVAMTYDRELETDLVPNKLLRETFWKVRDNVEKLGLRRVWGTRELMAGHTLLESGESMRDVLFCLSEGWTDDERKKAGIGV